MKTGILLINIGSPQKPNAVEVKKYLLEFLSDYRIVDYPPWLWQPILRYIILPRRVKKITKLYAKIWKHNQSPLIQNGKQISDKLQKLLPESKIYTAMRYGQPCIKDAFAFFKDNKIKNILILPLFPQFSHSTHTSIQDIAKLYTTDNNFNIKFVNGYCQHPSYINALTLTLNNLSPDTHLVISYHGLPKRYIKNGDIYEQECLATTTALIQKLNLNTSQFTHCYQSKFGPEAWLSPNIKDVLISLIHKNKTKVLVICPGFASDCLETLEEVAVQYKNLFIQNGGQSFKYVPALGTDPKHIETLNEIIQENL